MNHLLWFHRRRTLRSQLRDRLGLVSPDVFRCEVEPLADLQKGVVVSTIQSVAELDDLALVSVKVLRVSSIICASGVRTNRPWAAASLVARLSVTREIQRRVNQLRGSFGFAPTACAFGRAGCFRFGSRLSTLALESIVSEMTSETWVGPLMSVLWLDRIVSEPEVLVSRPVAGERRLVRSTSIAPMISGGSLKS